MTTRTSRSSGIHVRLDVLSLVMGGHAGGHCHAAARDAHADPDATTLPEMPAAAPAPHHPQEVAREDDTGAGVEVGFGQESVATSELHPPALELDLDHAFGDGAGHDVGRLDAAAEAVLPGYLSAADEGSVAAATDGHGSFAHARSPEEMSTETAAGAPGAYEDATAGEY